MSWVQNIDVDILPLISNFAPKSFKKLNPKKLSKELGTEYNFERWCSVLSNHRIKLSYSKDFCAEYDNDNQIIFISINETVKLFELLQTILHEMIHVNQFSIHEDMYYKNVKNKNLEEDELYYSYFGEIQAYAHCIFLESQDTGHIMVDTVYRYDNMNYSVKRKLITQIMRWENRYFNYGIKLNYKLFPSISSGTG